MYVAQDPYLALDNSTYDETSAQQIQRSPMANTHSFANFQGFVAANIKTFVHTSICILVRMYKCFNSNKTFVHTDENANRFIMRLWNDLEAMTDGFDKLIDIISSGNPIHSTSDGSVLSDGHASAGWLFWRPAAESDTILDATRYITTMQQNQTNAVNSNNNNEINQLSRAPHDEEPSD